MSGMKKNVTRPVLSPLCIDKTCKEMTAVVQLTTVETIHMVDASKYCHRIVEYCDRFEFEIIIIIIRDVR